MNIAYDSVGGFRAGITHTILAVACYSFAGGFGVMAGGDFVISALEAPLYLFFGWIANVTHVIGFVYHPINLYLIFKFLEGESSLIKLSIQTFLINFISLKIIDYGEVSFRLIAMLALLAGLMVLEVALRRRVRRAKQIEDKDIEHAPPAGRGEAPRP